ncbi:MAG: hypothetical protein KC441_02450 [Anaerolineales bacterium]|nr:hypothetical protein [Anaerolineales bacterium]
MKKSLLAGFHLGVGGSPTGIGDKYYKKLAARGIPFVIMSADNFPAEAQELARNNPNVRHFVGYRRSTKKPDAGGPDAPPSGDPNVPRYGVSAQKASDEHWAWHTAPHILPPEYDGRFTYLITVNEPNKDDDTYVEWLAEVEYYNCLKALAAGFRYAVFGWSGGTPEPYHWQGSNMKKLLDLIEQHPEQLAVATHEYSWTTSSIWAGSEDGKYDRVGRAYKNLLRLRPSLPLVITEFGWAERAAPSDVSRAIEEIREVGELYAPYPNYLGAAVWYLGPGFGEIDKTVNRYIGPLGDEIISHPIEVPDAPEDPPPPPPPPSGGPVLGTDVSHHQGVIDFQQMAAAGARFVFIKASERVGWKDSRFNENWAKAGAQHWIDGNGHVWPLLRGAYHFYRNSFDPISQAAWFLENVPASDRGELPLVVDLEDKSTLQGEQLLRFMQHIYQIDGRRMIVYTGGWWVRGYLRGDVSWLAEHPLWHTPLDNQPPAPWDSILIDQDPSTLRGREFGCQEEGLDINYFQGSEAALLQLARLPSPGRGRPRESYQRVYWLVGQNIGLSEYLELAKSAWTRRRTLGFSFDDAGIGALEKKYAMLFDMPEADHDGLRTWFTQHYPGTNLTFTTFATGEGKPETDYTSHMVGRPRLQYARTFWCVPQNIPQTLYLKLAEQAWAEKRTLGFSYDDAGIGDLEQRTAVLFNIPDGEHERYRQWFDLHYPGTKVTFQTVAEDSPPVTPPPSGTAVVGLHASADPGLLYGGIAELQEFQALKPGVVKVLSAIADYAPPGKAALADLVDKNRQAQWIVRAFLHFGGRNISPERFFTDTINDVRRAVQCLRAFGVQNKSIWIELHNEVNLLPEGYGISWKSPSDFGVWLNSVLMLYRAALPDLKYLYPGLSPGGDERSPDGTLLRRDAAAFLNGSRFVLDKVDGIGVHCYWQPAFPMSQALAHLDTYAGLGKPVWVTEASNNKRTVPLPSAQDYASQYVAFLNHLRQRPWVYGVTYFVASASNPKFQPESWVSGGNSKGIARLVADAG